MLKITDKYIFFYKEWPSNFRRTHFVWSNSPNEQHEFFCAEQAFMFAKAKKFQDEEIANLILNAGTPQEAKNLGRMVRNYSDSEWSKIRYEVMKSVNYARFSQDKELNKMLLNPDFDGKTFVEASPVDLIWGVGLSQDDSKIEDPSNWKGKNLLGRAITEVRNILKIK